MGCSLQNVFKLSSIVLALLGFIFSIIALVVRTGYHPNDDFGPPIGTTVNESGIFPTLFYTDFPSVWTIAIDDGFKYEKLEDNQKAGAVWMGVVVFLGLVPTIFNLLGFCFLPELGGCKAKTIHGCPIFGYLLIFVFACCYWVYTASPTHSDLPYGPCVGKYDCGSLGFKWDDPNITWPEVRSRVFRTINFTDASPAPTSPYPILGPNLNLFPDLWWIPVQCLYFFAFIFSLVAFCTMDFNNSESKKEPTFTTPSAVA